MIRRVLILSIVAAVLPLPLAAQSGAIVAGASAVAELPVGSLGDRYAPAAGGMVYVGQRTSSDWTWVGKLEYFRFNNLNRDGLTKKVRLQEGGATQEYQIPLKGLSMEFRAVGLTAEAITGLVRWDMLEVTVHGGFGFYNWRNVRGGYYDSLFVTSTVTGLRTKAATLAVPEHRQEDWSGSFNLGIDAALTVVEPVALTAAIDYRLIIAELWPALDLGLENISGLHAVSVRVGLKAEF